MKRATILWAMCTGLLAQGQLHVDKPLVLTGTDAAQRGVDGLAPANGTSNLITVEGARAGRYHWAQTAGTAMAITLSAQPACAAYQNGLELRFMPNASAAGAVTINVDGLGAKRLYRTDGMFPAFGELAPGRISTIVYQDSAFFLMDRPRENCPSGFYDVNGQYCIQRNDTLSLSVFNATKWCGDRGARLCTWGEYIHACTVHQSAMEGMFDEWEWIDDSSDHTHTGVQAGRWQCRSERSFVAAENPNNYAQVRCCYSIR